MASITELIELQQHQRGQGAPANSSGLFEVFAAKMKADRDEKRRQENVKTQMANAQQMMQQMSQMGDNSSVGRVNGALDSDQQKRQRGVINVSTMMPQKEMTVDETGAVNIKLGFKQATPQEQKAQFEMQKQQMDLEREEGKRSLLGGYIKGELQEGALIQGMKEFNITPDEFDQAAQARERMRQLSGMAGQQPQIPQGFEATEMQRDMMGNLRPAGIKRVQQPTEMDALNAEAKRLDIARTMQDLEPQPLSETEKLQQEQMRLGMDKTRQEMALNADAQPFRFKRPIEEQKFAAEQSEKVQREQEKIDLAKANAESAIGAINEIRKTMGHFGLMGNVWATPGTDKVAWSKNIDRVKAMLTLDNLMELKNASKNGASGLGALSDGERKMLEDAASALDKGLPKEKAAEYLNDIERTLTRVLGGGQSTGQAQSQSTVPQVGGMFNGEKVLSIKRIK